MAKTKAPRGRKKAVSRGWKPWQKRLFSALLTIFCILMVLALLLGKASLQEDMQALKNAGGFIKWFSAANGQTANLMGVFGVIFGNLFVWVLGYWFALIASLVVGIISLQYFLEPQATRSRRKYWLLLITAFLFQTYLSRNGPALNYSVIPGFVYRVLMAVFSPVGAGIILIVSMVLSIILILEYRRIKDWFLLLHENMERRSEEREKKPEKPTINKDEGVPFPPKDSKPDVQPVILDHAAGTAEAKNFEPETPRPASRPAPTPAVDDEDDDREYVMPSISDFLESPVKLSDRDRKEIEAQILTTSQALKNKLSEFGIDADVRNVNIGPIITQYELEPAPGVKVNSFTSLADDLALAIKAKSIRVQAPIPGRGLIGIEIPNMTRDMIYLRDLLLSEEIRGSRSKLMFGLGKDIAGKPVVTDLTKMPHLLIAGATGSGKSVCINTIIMSLIMRTTPDDLRLILIDPKRVELAGYNELPHLIGNVVTDPDNALENMYWAVKEMERRYELLQEAKVRDITGYNERVEEDSDLEKLPYIVIIVDEFADLIMTSGKDIELPITRLAQMSRAVGIHLILATQRPSIKVITGIIKANFPARIAFQVSSRVDSRVILDMIGAERLLGSGDMLFLPPGKAVPERIHGAFVSDHEIARVCDFLGMQPKPKMDFSLPSKEEGELGSIDYDDDLFPEAAKLVISANTASVSMLQRHFKIGYSRAGRLIDLLERAHIIGPHLGSKSRDVLANRDDLVRMGLARED